MSRFVSQTALTASFIALGIASMASAHAAPGDQAPGQAPPVGKSLTFLATFDHGPDADFAKGDPKIYTTLSGKRDEAKPGLPDDVVIAKGKGRRGDALKFTKKSKAVVFFKVDKNLDYSKKDWGGTASFWISVDPDKELDPDYVDPFHITEKSWDDGGLWVDFSKDDHPRHLRLGAFADKKVWNPSNKGFEKMTPAERPMFDSGKPPFATGKWSNVVIVFDHFNTGKKDGIATLYINGQKKGSVSGRDQTYTWDPEKAAIMLGLSYTGMLDEIAVFDRPLTDDEVRKLYEADGLPNFGAK
jgi:hypothetical protein